MSDSGDGEILARAREIAALEREATKLVATDFDLSKLAEIVGKYIEAKDVITRHFIDGAAIYATDEVSKRLLRKLRDGEELLLDRLITFLESKDDEPLTIASIVGDVTRSVFYEEMDDIASDVLWSWIHPHEIMQGLFEAGVLVLGRNLPREIAGYVEEARWCFAIRKYRAVGSLCRTIIEIAARDICTKKGFFRRSGNVRDIEEVKFWPLVRKAADALPQREQEDVEGLYSKLSRFVHARDLGQTLATANLGDTLRLVERLYAANKMDA